MKRSIHAVFLAWLGVIGFSPIDGNRSCQAADAEVRQVGSLTLSVDSDLDLQPATEGDLIKWPIVADWDQAGRLVVAECGGVGKPIAEHNQQRLHRIVRLVDTNRDGKFDQRIVAAADLAFPEGVLCVGNSILVSAPPEIWKLTDADDDGICEQREVWYDPGTLTGCANDLHGPYLGRDGWIYWCKGAFAEQHHALINGKQLTTKAAHIFRRRLTGGLIEPVMTGGMDNPVELAISHTGERFFTSTFLQNPADGLRDGIAHAVYGGVYGKVNDAAKGHPRTGDLMPIMTHLGPAAPSGLICLESDRLLGPASKGIDTLIAAQFNLHKVTAHRLIPRGAGFVTEDHTLVSSDRIDFHPTDIIEAADGSLLVIDTGGWYNLCCPSSHVDQSIANGGIYRLTSPTTRKTAAGPLQDWNQLSLLQARAIVDDSQQPLRNRQQALWRVCRLSGERAEGADQVLVAALSSKEPSLRQIAAHSVSVERIAAARQALTESLIRESEPAVLRTLAEALGRLGDSSCVQPLVDKLAQVQDDRMLEHSLIYALIELDQPDALVAHLNTKSVSAMRGVMLALDQGGHSDRLDLSALVQALASSDAALRQTAAEILSRHSEWASGSTVQLGRVWEAAEGDTAQWNSQSRSSLAKVIAAWSQSSEIIQLVGQRINLLADSTNAPSREQLERTLSLLGGLRNQKLPSVWAPGVMKLLERCEPAARIALADWISGLKLEEPDALALTQSVNKLLQQTSDPISQLHLIGCLSPRASLADQASEQMVVDHFLSAGTADSQASAAASKALARIKLRRESAARLIEQLERVPPLELMVAVSSVAALDQDSLDSQMLQRLVSLPAARTLAFDQLSSLYRHRGEDLNSQVRATVETLSKPPADVEAKLDELLGKLKSGDPARGFQVFRGSKAACSACHRVGYVGGTIGPELSRIGATRTRRALLEAIVFPNARLEQSYTPVKVLTVDGLVYNGLVARQTETELELVTGANQRVTIAKEDIQQQQASQTSIMPAGLEQQLTLDELADLLTLLESAGR